MDKPLPRCTHNCAGQCIDCIFASVVDFNPFPSLVTSRQALALFEAYRNALDRIHELEYRYKLGYYKDHKE